jgi:hypothetical protein
MSTVSSDVREPPSQASLPHARHFRRTAAPFQTSAIFTTSRCLLARLLLGSFAPSMLDAKGARAREEAAGAEEPVRRWVGRSANN